MRLIIVVGTLFGTSVAAFGQVVTEFQTGDVIPYAWIVRLIERLSLSFVIITLAIVIIIAFWNGLQKIDITADTKGVSFGANVLLATPILILLILVGYSYIVLSFPLSSTHGESDTKNENQQASTRYANSPTDMKRLHEVGAAISSMDYLRKTNQIIITLPDNRAEFDDAMRILKEYRAELVISNYGKDSIPLWNANGEDYLLNPGEFNQNENERLSLIAPWFKRLEKP